MPYLVAARRLGVPVVGLRRVLGPHGGEGVVSPHLDLYVVQNEIMRSDLVRYHGIDPARITITGWPQTDVYHRRRPTEAYAGLLRRYDLDPDKPLMLFAGNTPDNAPYEGKLVERLLASGGSSLAPEPLLAPLPPASARQPGLAERFGAAAGVPGAAVQAPSYTDLEDLATLLQHADVVVANAGTILLDALVNDRPAVCVLWDEGAPAGERWADRNLVGDHYKQLAESGAFLRAHDFDELVCGNRPRALTAWRAGRRARADRTRGGRRGGRQGGRAGRRGDRLPARMTRPEATLVLYSRLAFYPVHWLALEEVVRRFEARAIVLAAAAACRPADRAPGARDGGVPPRACPFRCDTCRAARGASGSPGSPASCVRSGPT